MTVAVLYTFSEIKANSPKDYPAFNTLIYFNSNLFYSVGMLIKIPTVPAKII